MVCLSYEPEALSIRVSDDGSGPLAADGGPSGHGLTGMAERAAAVGGTFSASAGPDGGFEVMARLPAAAPDRAAPAAAGPAAAGPAGSAVGQDAAHGTAPATAADSAR
jgi:signal transduction histidine kinase